MAEFLCDCCDAGLGCQFDFSGIAVVLLWDFYRIAMRLLSSRCGIPVGSFGIAEGIIVGLLWDCYGIAVRQL